MQTNSFLRKASLIAALAVATFSVNRGAYARAVLPTGATITPKAAPGSVFQPLRVTQRLLPTFPIPNYKPDGAETTAISPDGKTLLILTSGYNYNENSSGSYDPTSSGEFVFVYDISKPSKPVNTQIVFLANERAFDGIVWSPNGTKFYVAGGADDVIYTFAQSNGQWTQSSAPINLNHTHDRMQLETEVGPTAASIGITADGNTLIVANHETDSITAVNVATGSILKEFDLRPGLINPERTGVPGGEFPYGIAVKGSDTVYVSSVRDREIDVLKLSNGTLTLTTRIPVDGNPEKMVLNRAQSKLFVVANNSDKLIIIDTTANRVVGQVNTSAPLGVLGFGNRIPKGINPNSVALSPDETIAYVTNGGTNSVAVISVAVWPFGNEQPTVLGLIPTGWYPNSVSVSPDGSTLYVVNSKSPETPNPLNCRYINNDPGGGYGTGCQSIAAQDGSANEYAWQNEYSGFLTLPVPNFFELPQLTSQVAQNNGFNFQVDWQDGYKMSFLHEHIQHVIYIIKENRTFDQVLGDLTNGANADPTLTQFPSFITPNFHDFANNFVTFDNFDDTSMVSMDGWQWSTAARALDINEKCVTVNYGKGGCNYDSEGTARNVDVAVVGATPELTVAARKAWQPLYPPDPNLLPGTANEVGADGPEGQKGLGYIWDAALNAGLTVRNYGFYLDLGASEYDPPFNTRFPPTLTAPCSANPPIQVAFPAHPALLNITDFCFRGFDQSFPDFFRFQEWNREFQQQVANNSFPNLTLLRLEHDHFGDFGTASFGVNTPELQIADNDYSVGLVAQTIAHSPYANNTLIFVIEDDPQDGADHVSGDRSLAFIIGPYVKQGAVVSHFYSTVSMVRTIEDVLGVSHLSIHDSTVPPMADAFEISQNCGPAANGGSTCWTYTATPAQILCNTQLPLPVCANVNPATLPKTTHDAAWWEAKTKGMNFKEEDANDPEQFNRIIWQGMMGDKPYPTMRSGVNAKHTDSPHPKTSETTDSDDE